MRGTPVREASCSDATLDRRGREQHRRGGSSTPQSNLALTVLYLTVTVLYLDLTVSCLAMTVLYLVMTVLYLVLTVLCVPTGGGESSTGEGGRRRPRAIWP